MKKLKLWAFKADYPSTVAVKITGDLHYRLRIKAQMEGITIKALMTRTIEELVADV